MDVLDAAGCAGLEEKLLEYAASDDRVDNLIAELRLASALVKVFGSLTLQSGAASDLRVSATNLDLTIEVEHKSSFSPFAEIFYPDPDLELPLAAGVKEGALRETARRLHSVVCQRNFLVEPWIGSELIEPCWGRSERTKQEELVISLANWLADQLAALPAEPAHLVHAHARFAVTPMDERGRISGHGPLDAFILHEYPDGNRVSLYEWFRSAVKRKAVIAKKHPERCGQLHLVGLVVDEAYALKGFPLANALLGGVTSSNGHHYRAVPAGADFLLESAAARGRESILDTMQFDRTKSASIVASGSLFDPDVYGNVDGILALYFTEALQFIPNPFSCHDVQEICSVFPTHLSIFDTAQCAVKILRR